MSVFKVYLTSPSPPLSPPQLTSNSPALSYHQPVHSLTPPPYSLPCHSPHLFTSGTTPFTLLTFNTLPSPSLLTLTHGRRIFRSPSTPNTFSPTPNTEPINLTHSSLLCAHHPFLPSPPMQLLHLSSPSSLSSSYFTSNAALTPSAPSILFSPYHPLLPSSSSHHPSRFPVPSPSCAHQPHHNSTSPPSL